MNKCTECGHCCVVFNHVGISEFEAELRGIKIDEDKENGMHIKRKEVFWGVLGYSVFICEYFDLDPRLCSIYQNRPDVCRNYICEWDPKKYPISKYKDVRDIKVQSEWESLLRGEYAQCLHS